jgi:hypothetical protein
LACVSVVCAAFAVIAAPAGKAPPEMPSWKLLVPSAHSAVVWNWMGSVSTPLPGTIVTWPTVAAWAGAATRTPMPATATAARPAPAARTKRLDISELLDS